MFHAKKISGDILHLALILAFVRLGPEILWDNQWHDPLEVGDIFIGSTLAYQQYYSSRDAYLSSSRYTNLKTLDTDIVDDLTLIRDRLDYFSRSSWRENVIAYYSDNADSQLVERRSNNSNSNNSENRTGEEDNTGLLLNSSNTVDNLSEVSSAPSVEDLLSPATVDLSPEDRNLIEILWRQDVDLGVSWEAFNSFENQDSEKLKAGGDLSENSKEFRVEEADLKTNNECDDEISLYNEWEGLCYTIDSETGEHIKQEQKPNEEQHEFSTNETLFNSEGFGDLSPSLFSPGDCETLNLTKALIEENDCLLSQSFNETLLVDPDVLAAQVAKLEDFVRNSEESLSQDESPQLGNEMYPSMEDYWQDISTTLPLSVGATSYQNCLPRPSRMLSEVADDQATAVASSSDLISRASVSDAFVGALYHNASLAQRSQDINSSFSYMPSGAIGPTSLGCAVASSIATLTNDTDPVPDISSTINGTYGLDLAGIFHPNNTLVASPNESLISEMLLEEELQLMNVGAAAEAVTCSSIAKMVNEHMDLSSDSVNSSNSGNVSSLSDCNADSRMKFEELTCTQRDSKESHCSPSKYSIDQPSVNLPYRHVDGSLHNANVDLSSSFRSNYSHYLQHNHSYHLPFANGNNSPKPVTRDKPHHSRSDDDNNKDEKRAKALKLPITINEIINLAIDEFNERLSKFELTEPQLTLIRDIRRRGKNKVAAQNCRKRKMDQISSLQQDLDLLQAERLQLESERTELLHQRRNMHDKYSQLCQLVFQSTSHPPFVPEVFPSSQQNDSECASSPSSNTTNIESHEKDLIFQGVRTKRKFDKKKTDLH